MPKGSKSVISLPFEHPRVDDKIGDFGQLGTGGLLALIGVKPRGTSILFPDIVEYWRHCGYLVIYVCLNPKEQSFSTLKVLEFSLKLHGLCSARRLDGK